MMIGLFADLVDFGEKLDPAAPVDQVAEADLAHAALAHHAAGHRDRLAFHRFEMIQDIAGMARDRESHFCKRILTGCCELPELAKTDPHLLVHLAFGQRQPGLRVCVDGCLVFLHGLSVPLSSAKEKHRARLFSRSGACFRRQTAS